MRRPSSQTSAAAKEVRVELVELGPSHLPIVLLGETGVGKEVAARAVHRLSGRRGAFVPVNISAIPSHLLEAELFGSVRGAYTVGKNHMPVQNFYLREVVADAEGNWTTKVVKTN